MVLLVKQEFFKIFPYRNSKNDDVIKDMAPFWIIFFMKQNIYMLLVMHAKFEVNSFLSLSPYSRLESVCKRNGKSKTFWHFADFRKKMQNT